MREGDKYKNFFIEKVELLPEIGCRLVEARHLTAGSRVIHLANDDSENLFCLAFQTVPESSNGVAHILEHTVLCGSEKFPVKDPFFAMTRRSLNTFMNAFTGSDFTLYPAASETPGDFYNLLEVYLDAVFRPRLHELSFSQEGHRYEFVDGSLKYKGVVFNEMKGAMALPDSRLREAIFSALFPDVTYGFNSGGDPQVIPQLSYRELLDFHKRYYHPGRCLFYFYGDMPLEGHLDFIEEKALKGVERFPAIDPIPGQPRFREKKRLEISYPATEERSDDNYIAFAYLTCDILEQKTLLALETLVTALFGTDAAPFKKKLIDSKLCKQVVAYLGEEIKETPFVLILKGCKKEAGSALERLINEELQKIAEEGIAGELLESALHQIEFNRSEISGDGYPYGLALFFRAGLLSLHGGNAREALLIHSLCSELRSRFAEDKRFVTDLVRNYFLNNNHFVRVIAYPDSSLAAREEEEEKKRLRDIEKALSDNRRKEIEESAEALHVFQKEQEKQDLEVLPKVTIEDVNRVGKDYPLNKGVMGKTTFFHHDAFTNGIVYADLVFPLYSVAEEDLALSHLFFYLLPQLGCGTRSWEENQEYIQRYTGGVEASQVINRQAVDSYRFFPYFSIGGKALFRNAKYLFPLLYDMAARADFSDIGRIEEIIGRHFVSLESNISGRALGYAIKLASSGLDVASRIGEAWGGLEYFYLVRKIASDFTGHREFLAEKLRSLQKEILAFAGPHLVITCSAKEFEILRERNFYGLDELAVTGEKAGVVGEYPLHEVVDQARIIAAPVAFSCKVFKSLSYSDPKSPYLSVAARLFNRLILHPRIRETGGAYGAKAVHNAMEGNFIFLAYRDPNIATTYEAFEESAKLVAEGRISSKELEESKLEVIQQLDAPVSPGSRGWVAYSWLREGRSLPLRQNFRDLTLKASVEDVAEAVSSEILPSMAEAKNVVFAGRDLLEKENRRLVSLGREPFTLKEI